MNNSDGDVGMPLDELRMTGSYYQKEPQLARKIIYALAAAMLQIFFMMSTFLFYHRRKLIIDLEARSLRLSLTFAISNIIFTPVLVLYNGFWSSFPCYVVLWNLHLSFLIYSLVMGARGARLIFLANLTYAILDISLKKNRHSTLLLKNVYDNDDNNNKNNDNNDNDDDNDSNAVTFNDYLKWYRRKKKFTTDKVLCYAIFGIVLIMVMALIGIVVFAKDDGQFSIKKFGQEQKRCSDGLEYLPLYTLITAFIFIECPVLFYYLKPLNENYGIKKEIFINLITTISCLILYLATIFLDQVVRFWGPLTWLSVALLCGHVNIIFLPVVKSYKKSNFLINYYRNGNRNNNNNREVYVRSLCEEEDLVIVDNNYRISCDDKCENYNNFNDSKNVSNDDDEGRPRFSQILKDERLFEKFKICAASFFCIELILFIEEYQYLKSKVLKYYDHTNDNLDSVADSRPITDVIDNIQSSSPQPLQPLQPPQPSYQHYTPWETIIRGGSPSSSLASSSSSTSTYFINSATSFSPFIETMDSDLKILKTITTAPSSLSSTTPLSNNENLRLSSLSPITISIPETLDLYFNSKSKFKSDSNSNSNSNSNSKSTLSPLPPKILPKELKPYYQRFYQTFLDPSAGLAINVDDSTLRNIRRQIVGQGDYNIDMFEHARIEVLHLLYGNTFNTFIEQYCRTDN